MAFVPSWVSGKGQCLFKARTMGKLLRSPNHSANGPSPSELRRPLPPLLSANPAVHPVMRRPHLARRNTRNNGGEGLREHSRDKGLQRRKLRRGGDKGSFLTSRSACAFLALRPQVRQAHGDRTDFPSSPFHH